MTGQAVRSRIIIIACFVTLSVLSFVGLAELACGNYPRDIAPWPTSCKHVFQGVLSADPRRIDVIHPGLEARPLHQGPPSCNLHWCVTFARLLGRSNTNWILVQMVSTIFVSFIQSGVKYWIFSNVPDICSPTQASHLTCPHNKVFFSASAIWCVLILRVVHGGCSYDPVFSIRGLIGPSRQFGRGSIYYPQLYAIIVGALLPFPFWIMQRRRPDSWAKFVSTPVVLLGVSFIPPATGINYSAWFAVGFVFQFIVRKRNFAWWSKYNYVTGAALDCGLFFSRYSLW